MVTRPACGIPAAPMLAAVAVTLKRTLRFLIRKYFEGVVTFSVKRDCSTFV